MPAEAAGSAITAAGSDPVRAVPEVSVAPEVRRRAGLSEEAQAVREDLAVPAEEAPVGRVAEEVRAVPADRAEEDPCNS